MEQKDNLPKVGLDLYVKMYSKRKNRTECSNDVVEATKSWISLSKNEKQKFIDKVKENQRKYKKCFANYLKNVKPFMKRNEHKSSLQEAENNKDNIGDIEMDSEVVPQDDIERTAVELETEQQNQSATEPHEFFILPEPTPPSLKTGKELFEMLMEKQGNDSTWISLSSREQKRYRSVILQVKKDYIQKYKAYLESLPPHELFDHYNNVI